MVICRFYQQGNCEYEQYCQFEHVNSFGNKGENYNEDEFAAAVVANEVLLAERGGQWLLSCFGVFKEKPCIPGMEDVSPEEVRWEIYQAEKNGMGQQAKLRYQQLCQEMKAKRDALKNPTSETIAMLKEVMGTSTKSSNTTTKSTFSFATPQLGLPSTTSSSNVFGNKTFGTQSNPFSRSFTSSTTNPIFGGPSQANTNPIFGGNPTFGTSLGTFGKASTSSVFDGTTNSLTFNTGQSTQNFGSITSQSNSIFGGGTAQPAFGQTSVFGTTNQTNNVFARPQTTQSTTSVFDSNATSTNSMFGSQMPSQSNPLFASPKTSTPNPFGGSSPLQTTANSVFGATTTAASFSTRQFSPSKPTFGGAPVFGAVSGIWNNNSGSIFGEQGAFAGSTNNPIFGGAKTTTSAFGSAPATNAFGATTTSVSNVFGGTTNTVPALSAPNTSPFATPTTSTPFASSATQFDATSTANNLFSKPAFGLPAMSTVKPFSTTVTSSATPFGNTNAGLPFGTPTTASSPFTSSTFGNMKSSPFASTITTTTATTANPFAPRNQQTMSPFGAPAQTQGSNTVTVSSSPFGRSPFGATVVTTSAIDESVYTEVGVLTDDEKSMYLAEKFILGKIPLKPPSKDIR